MNSLMIMCRASNIILPLPAQCLERKVEHAVYSRFMRNMRVVPIKTLEAKILSAIRFSADMLDYSDAHVAKVLVELGLRAPRSAFPADFLSYADEALLREPQDVGGPSESLLALRDYWITQGEDPYTIPRGQHSFLDDIVAPIKGDHWVA